MKTLTDIPFSIDVDSLIKRSRIAPDSDDARDFRSLVQLAVQEGKPKATYTVGFIDVRDRDTVRIEGVRFTSRALVRNLQFTERVFPFVATCGRELDEVFPAKGDMLLEFWWDLIKTQLLLAAEHHVRDHLHRVFRLGKTATMRPGSADATIWPIEQQQELFALLGDVDVRIGVKLTESSLMIPNKTTSGFLFPTEQDFRSCEVCQREDCPSRHAPFNPELWEELQHD